LFRIESPLLDAGKVTPLRDFIEQVVLILGEQQDEHGAAAITTPRTVGITTASTAGMRAAQRQ
jgi:hypothetical protein